MFQSSARIIERSNELGGEVGGGGWGVSILSEDY